ncbi:asparagine synthase (glutamine-hydrolyzing) [Actinoplanes sp. N902-109]|nr:asparagine synthase (glutamine-hydrolyzing) [Actinoplanes sp. N902-109]
MQFDRDISAETRVGQAMTGTMACRGPDDEGLWTDPHAQIGHRRLAVIDIEGGRQPMTAQEQDRTLAVLTYSGEVYNYRQVRAELVSLGHTFRTGSDTEVVLRAYLEWGATFVDRLHGMFAFAIWDPREQELLLVRDRLGIKPLFYHPLPGGVLFGSEPKAILAHPAADRTVDADGLREIFSDVQTPGASVYRGMRQVRPGHVIRFRPDGRGDRRYWGVEAREHTDDLDTTIGTIRGLLTDIVTEQLVADVPLCVLLSGGLDSSTVTALAARAVAGAGGGPLRTFSVDFVDQDANFKPDIVRPVQDAPYIREVVKHVGTEHREIVLGNEQLLQPEVRASVIRALDHPLFMGDTDASLYLLFRSIREHSTVALSGEGSDESFAGYPYFHRPEYMMVDEFPWSTASRSCLTGLFAPALADLDVASYRADQYQQALAEVPRLAGETGLPKRMREVLHFFVTRFVSELLSRKDRLSMANGLEVRVPYCDHRLVEYVFNVPWDMKGFDGREKSLLRAAAADLVPASVLSRPKTGYPVTHDSAYDRAAREELAKLSGDANAPVQPLLSQDVLRAVRDDPEGATTSALTRVEVDLALNLNSWLEMNRLRLVP